MLKKYESWRGSGKGGVDCGLVFMYLFIWLSFLYVWKNEIERWVREIVRGIESVDFLFFWFFYVYRDLFFKFYLVVFVFCIYKLLLVKMRVVLFFLNCGIFFFGRIFDWVKCFCGFVRN